MLDSRLIWRLILRLMSCLCCTVSARMAAIACALLMPALIPATAIAEIAHVPPHRRHATGVPLTMINLPVDRRLFELAHAENYHNADRYQGYFSHTLCYRYMPLDRRFEATGPMADGYCSGDWSGNFLNWATMTRIDIARDLLYGGYRVQDSASGTVLERTIPSIRIAPQWRTYQGTDLDRLTPLSPNTLGNAQALQLCNIVEAGVPLLRMRLRLKVGAALVETECVDAPERAQERTQERAPEPVPDMVVRILACIAPTGHGDRDCKTYPQGKARPVGVLQRVAESGMHEIGLLTGMHGQGKATVTLTRNARIFADEVRAASTGDFSTVAGIVSAIDALREEAVDARAESSTFSDPNGPLALDSLRYFAGREPIFADTPGAGPSSWRDPFGTNVNDRANRAAIFGDPACRPLRILTFDSGIPLMRSDLGGAGHESLTELTRQIARDEGLDIDLAQQGAYLLAGLALHAQRNPVRTDLDMPADASRAFRVETIGVSLGVPGPRSPLYYAAKVGNPAYVPQVPVPVSNYVDLKSDMGVAVRGLLESAHGFGMSAAVASSSVLRPGDQVYVAEYYPTQRGGNLLAYGIDATGQIAGAPLWQGRDTVREVVPAERVILTLNGLGAGVAFQWSGIDEAQRGQLNRTSRDASGDQYGERRLAWLRGSRLDETGGLAAPDGGIAAGGLFRDRPNGPLGALVNSNPWLMLAPSAGHAQAVAPGYADFRQAHLQRTPMLFVGAEDGMLHGFNADDGRLLMSYVPRALFDQLARLTVPDGPARPYVDGSPLVADVNLNMGYPSDDEAIRQGWRSMLFAPLGRGGQGLLALDVTEADFSEDAASSIVRWEFSDADDADLGNIIARPGIDEINGQPRQVVRMANGRWAWLIGNGYDSDRADQHAGSGHAVLFILYINGPSGPGATWVLGRDYLKITTGPRGSGPANGLGAPFPIDTDGDGKVDAIYAGDRKGNIWKFDVGSASDSDWKPAFIDARTATSLPFFTANPDASLSLEVSVTAAVLAMPHPLGGTMVNFGTGKAIEADDLPTRQVQTLFGIRDRPGAQHPPASGRERLLRQTASIASDGSGVFSTSHRITDWDEHDGWLLDLPMKSESVLADPAYGSAGMVTFKTDFKSVAPRQACGSGWDANLWMLNALDGSAPAHGFDVNGDGRFDAADLTLNDSGNLQSLSGIFIRHGNGEVSRLADGQLIRGGGASASVRRIIERRNATGGRLYWRELSDPN